MYIMYIKEYLYHVYKIKMATKYLHVCNPVSECFFNVSRHPDVYNTQILDFEVKVVPNLSWKQHHLD